MFSLSKSAFDVIRTNCLMEQKQKVILVGNERKSN